MMIRSSSFQLRLRAEGGRSRRRLVVWPASLGSLVLALLAPTSLAAAVNAAVIEHLALEARPPGVRLEIAVDRELPWTVDRDPEGRLRIALPNARPGHGVVSQILPGGLVSEIRIVAAGLPSRPLTHIVVATRGAADHRFDVDGRSFRLELVPTGEAFPARPRERVRSEPPATAPATRSPAGGGGEEMPVPDSPTPGPTDEDPWYDSPVPRPEAPAAPSPASPPLPALDAEPPPTTVPELPLGVESPDRASPPTATEPPVAAESAPVVAPEPTIVDEPAVPAAADLDLEIAPAAPMEPPPARLEPVFVAGVEEWGVEVPTSLEPRAGSTAHAHLEVSVTTAPRTEPDPPAVSAPALTSDPIAALDPEPELPAPLERPASPASLSVTHVELPVDLATGVPNLSGAESGPIAPPVGEPLSGPVARLLETATQLLTIARLGPGVLGFAGDGGFEFTGFRLENPERFVIDLHGVVNRSEFGALDLDEGLLVRVRVSQYRTRPTPVTRVIFDLRAPTVPAIERAADGLLVRFALGGSPSAPPH